MSGVVAAYGEILRKNVLAIPPLGYLNIHPSLLPRHRGPTPVAGAILAGDTETGVTVMLLDAKMDSGPILAQQRVPLPPDARSQAADRASCSRLAPRCCWRRWRAMPPARSTQRRRTTARPPIPRCCRKKMARSTGARRPIQIERMTRAYDPWPGAQTTWRGQPLKIIAARAHADWRGGAPPGTLLDQHG